MDLDLRQVEGGLESAVVKLARLAPSLYVCTDTYRSQARFAQVYTRAISSSPFTVHLFLDCASKELASSMSSGGSGPDLRGIIVSKACSMGLLMLNTKSCGESKSKAAIFG